MERVEKRYVFLTRAEVKKVFSNVDVLLDQMRLQEVPDGRGGVKEGYRLLAESLPDHARERFPQVTVVEGTG